MESDRAPAVLPHHHELAGRPLTSHDVIVQTIAATTTRTGLTVQAELDSGCYPTGVKVSDAELNAVPITGHAFHGEWNCTVHPRPAEPADPTGPAAGPVAVIGRAALSHPALTGMTRTALIELTAALAADWQALREQDQNTRRDGGERRRAPGGGRKAKLNLTDRVLATVLQQRLTLPPSVLADLFTVSKDTIRHATKETAQLKTRQLGPEHLGVRGDRHSERRCQHGQFGDRPDLHPHDDVGRHVQRGGHGVPSLDQLTHMAVRQLRPLRQQRLVGGPW
jgi:hypothetical protein